MASISTAMGISNGSRKSSGSRASRSKEHSNRQLWGHVGRMNEEAAHKVSRSIANVCARYPGCVLLFERLRKIPAKGGSRPGPYADEHTRQGGGAIAGLKGARS